MRTDYQRAITESEQELRYRERELRGETKRARVRMLWLLRTGQATSLPKCVPVTGYSLRQLTRWWGALQGVGAGGAAGRQAATRQGKQAR